jgi:predicted DNA-binding transcriptional regulator AlpA
LPTIILSPEIFEREAQRRLIDTHELMLKLGLRSRAAVWGRVDRGTLPPPIIRKDNAIAFWDRDALDLPDRKENE